LSVGRVSIVVIGYQQWPIPQQHIDRVVAAVNAAIPGSFMVVDVLSPFGADLLGLIDFAHPPALEQADAMGSVKS
jgi:hypothetical protein